MESWKRRIYRRGKNCSKDGLGPRRDLDLVELNEAFAVAAIAVTGSCASTSQSDVNGGGRAGHPMGHRVRGF